MTIHDTGIGRLFFFGRTDRGDCCEGFSLARDVYEMNEQVDWGSDSYTSCNSSVCVGAD